MKQKLEKYYLEYNKRSYVHPDPLEFLYNYMAKEDIEIVGLIASSLAFGRVSQILKSVSTILDTMGDSPKTFLTLSSQKSLKKELKGFVYRFVGEKEIAALLYAIKNIIEDFGSIESCFIKGISKNDKTVLNGLHSFDENIRKRSDVSPGYLFADPAKGSGCKRMNLYLRWMIRNDEVDTGIWKGVPASRLIVPIDTHMHKISLKLGLTKRKQPNMKTALEITDKFAELCPEDPVKYDFSLTRFGIRDDMNIDEI